MTKDGVRYSHIIDPTTNSPLNTGLLSVTVVCADGLLSDGLSTSCFILDVNKSYDLLKGYRAEGIFVYEDHEVFVTDGLRELFTLTSNDYYLKDD